jgi:intein-encoded DNA endonuclease-like protein
MDLSVELVNSFLKKNKGKIQPTALSLGVRYQTIYNFVKKHNIPYNSTIITISPDEIRAMYNNLGSLSKVADQIGSTKEGIRAFMQRHNIPIKELIKYDVNHGFFKKESEEVFYWAGFIAADGCVKHRGSSCELQIALSSKDYEHIEKFKNTLNYTGPIRQFIIKNSKRNPKWNDTEKSEIAITSQVLFEDLAKFNIVPRKSLTYTFPDWLVNHPLVNHYMRGYFDGDGSWHWQKYKQNKQDQLIFSLRGTVEFLKIYRYILERDIDVPVRTKPIRISSGIGILEYGGNGITNKIAKFLYKNANIYLDRKREFVVI